MLLGELFGSSERLRSLTRGRQLHDIASSQSIPGVEGLMSGLGGDFSLAFQFVLVFFIAVMDHSGRLQSAGGRATNFKQYSAFDWGELCTDSPRYGKREC